MLAIQKKLRYQIVKEQFLPGTAEAAPGRTPVLLITGGLSTRNEKNSSRQDLMEIREGLNVSQLLYFCKFWEVRTVDLQPTTSGPPCLLQCGPVWLEKTGSGVLRPASAMPSARFQQAPQLFVKSGRLWPDLTSAARIRTFGISGSTVVGQSGRV